MQNMDFYYDFSGQKFGYPLSLSINSFSRTAFSRQTSLEISYVLKGEYEAITSSFTETMREGDMILIAPYEIHMLRKLDEKSTILTLHIDFERMSDSMTGDTRDAFSSAICSEARNRESYMAIKREMGKLLTLLMENGDDIYKMNAIMMNILLISSKRRKFSMEDLPLQSDQRENYMRAIKFIEENYQQPLTLGTIAEKLSYSLSYTSKMMKKYTGIPFVKYLAYVRVRGSLEALLEGKDSIEKIAEDSGLSSGKAYSSAFKELYGITPSSYRKQFQQNLKYTEGNVEKKMELDESQKELLTSLIEEAKSNIYDKNNVSITEKDGKLELDIANCDLKLVPGKDGKVHIEISRRK